MWENFWEMPFILKFYSFAFLIAGFSGLFSILPWCSHTNFQNQEVTYFEWWASGAGFFQIGLCAFLALTAILLLKKHQWGRHLLFMFFVFPPILAAFFGEEETPFIIAFLGISALAFIVALYLYCKKSTMTYFGDKPIPNNTIKRSA